MDLGVVRDAREDLALGIRGAVDDDGLDVVRAERRSGALNALFGCGFVEVGHGVTTRDGTDVFPFSGLAHGVALEDRPLTT